MKIRELNKCVRKPNPRRSYKTTNGFRIVRRKMHDLVGQGAGYDRTMNDCTCTCTCTHIRLKDKHDHIFI